MKQHFLILISFLLWATGLSAQSFRLVPGEPLHTDAAAFAAKGRQGILIRQRLTFGPYTTAYVRRSAIRKWTSGSGVPGIFWAEHMTGRQSLRLSLTDGPDTVSVEAVSRVRSTDLIFGDRPNSLPNILMDVLLTGSAAGANNFSATIAGRGDDQWALFLDNTAAQLRREAPAGFLRHDSGWYTIVPVWTVERKGKTKDLLFGAAGLEFRDEQGRTCAAVSLLNNGEVYLSSTDSRNRTILAAACAALLLQENIE